MGPPLVDTNQNMKTKGEKKVEWKDLSSVERFECLLRRWMYTKKQAHRRSVRSRAEKQPAEGSVSSTLKEQAEGSVSSTEEQQAKGSVSSEPISPHPSSSSNVMLIQVLEDDDPLLLEKLEAYNQSCAFFNSGT